MKKTFRALLIIAGLSASLAVVSRSQNVSAAPFVCEPGFYQSTVFGTFKKLNPVDGSYEDIGTSSATSLNAIGYNTQDNYIYGINNDANDNLVRIEDNANTVNLGTPTGLTPGNYVAGDMDHSGNLYVTEGTNLWVIDVSAGTATSIPLSTSISANDLVYIDGFLYSTNATSLYEINISNGNVTTKALGLPAATYGAGWATVEDKLYFGNNTTGVIYEVEGYDTLSPTFKAALNGEGGLVGNDGAACALAASVIVPINAVNDTYQTIPGSELTVSAANGLLKNDTPEGVTVDSYTQPSNGTVVVSPDGSFTYTPSPGFVGTDSFTYTIINSVGETETATVTIVVEAETDATEAGELANTGDSGTLMAGIAFGIIAAVVVIAKFSPLRSYRLVR